MKTKIITLKITFFIPILAIFISSCESRNDLFAEHSYHDRIELEEIENFGDSVKLTWSKLDTISFIEYYVLRNEGKVLYDVINFHSSGNVIARIIDKDITSYIDMDLLYAEQVSYRIAGVLAFNSNTTPTVIYSNAQELIRTDVALLNVNPIDILCDKNRDLLYFIEESGTITVYNYATNEIENSIDVQATIGYCDIKNYNFRSELYVPRNDGWVFVYDAITLEKIDQIHIGHPSVCVVANNGQLFVSTDEWTRNPLKVFDRSTKSFIDESGEYDWTRLKLVPGSNTELIEISLSVFPADLNYYSFHTNGQTLNRKNDKYHNDYPLDADIFEMFPTGNKIITAMEGAIYSKDLTYESRLLKGNLEFSTFAFTKDNKYILAGCSNNKSIEKFSISGYENEGTYETKGYPFKLFIDDKIICISRPNQNNNHKLFIETIDL